MPGYDSSDHELETPDAAGFLPVCRLGDLRRGKMTVVNVEGQAVVLTLLAGQAGDQVAAFTSICPHALGNLSYGAIYKGEVDCPDHGYRFDVRTGACVYPEGGPGLALYPVLVEADGTVRVKVERPRWMRGA